MRRELKLFLQAAYTTVAIFAFQALLPLASAQSLQITSPKNQTVVNPGQTITVTMASFDTGLSKIFIVGADPLDGCEAVTAPSIQCEMQIPSDIDPGTYTLIAAGITTAGMEIDSDPVSLDVERLDSPLNRVYALGCTQAIIQSSNVVLVDGPWRVSIHNCPGFRLDPPF